MKILAIILALTILSVSFAQETVTPISAPADGNATAPIDNNSTKPEGNSTAPIDNNSTKPEDNSTAPIDNNSTKPEDNSTAPIDNNTTKPEEPVTQPAEENNSTAPVENNSTKPEEPVTQPAEENNSTAPVENNTTKPEEPIAGGWTNIDPTAIKDTPGARRALFFGSQFVAEQAHAVGALGGNWSILKVWDAASQVVAGVNYKFNATLADKENATIETQFTVYVFSAENHTEVISYAYAYGSAPEIQINWVDNKTENGTGQEYSRKYSNIPENETLEDGPLSLQEFYAIDGYEVVEDLEAALALNDTQNALSVGIAEVGTLGVSFGFLTRGNWSLIEVNDIAQKSDNGTWYQFLADITNGAQDAIAYFIVQSDPANNITDVAEWGIQDVQNKKI